MVAEKRYITFGLLMLIFGLTFSQTSTITGVVQTKKDSTAIEGASIYIPNTIYDSFSEEGGEFIIYDVEPGTYDIVAEDLVSGDIDTLSGVVVTAGDTIRVILGVGVTTLTGDVIHFTYEVEEGTDAASGLAEEKDDKNVATVITTAAIKEKGDSKVVDAAGRASGVTVEGGKYVYVRGLSDRYSKTLLDATEIPGLDPNRNAVQLDMFPTSFVQSLKVIKSFSPDLPGDFTGGLVDIRTKEYPDSLEVSVSIGVKYNTQASFNSNFLTAPKSNTDFLGFDNGQRALPNTINSMILSKSYPLYGKALFDDAIANRMETASDLLNSDLVPIRGQSATPFKFGATMGKTYYFKQKGDSLGTKSIRKLGVMVGMNYSSSVSYFNEGTTNVYDLSGSLNEKSELNAQRIMSMEKASEAVLIGSIAKVGFEFNENHKLGFSFLKNQSGKQTVSIAEGENVDDEFYYRSQKIGYLERAMNNFILNGDHTILTKKNNSIIIDWATAYTLSSQEEPDLRFFNDNLDENDNPEFREQNYTGPVRYWRAMNEISQDAKLNVTLPINLDEERTLKIKMGGSYVNKNRSFDEKRLDYAVGPQGTYNGNVADFLSDDNTGYLGDNPSGLNDIGVYTIDQTNEVNNYTGLSTIMAGYAMTDVPFNSRLQTSLGMRFEKTDIEVQSKKQGALPSTLIENSFLPALNISYNIIDGKEVKNKKDTSITRRVDFKLKSSFSKTLARPNFRELAPFAVEDFVNNSVVIGNPDLQLTEILNYDVRFEFYPRHGEQFSVAGFYKDFTNPIEQITSPTAANIEYTWVNNGKGRLYGVEFEMRKKLNFISESLSNFVASGNLTLVKSSADVNPQELELIRGNDPDHADTRPLFGQSPYIVNGTISYKNDSSKINANVTFNVFGERLVLVTKGGLPDIYELPRPTLDLNFSKQFDNNMKLTFRAKNLLNPEFKQVYKVKTESANYILDSSNEEFVYRNYKKGLSFSLSVSYKF